MKRLLKNLTIDWLSLLLTHQLFHLNQHENLFYNFQSFSPPFIIYLHDCVCPCLRASQSSTYLPFVGTLLLCGSHPAVHVVRDRDV